MIKLGQQAKDKVSGFKGILTGRASYITGCDQYCIAPTVGKDGEVKDGRWFDEGRIQITGKGINIFDVLTDKKGGPAIDCPKGKYQE